MPIYSELFTATDRTPFFYILTHISDGKRYAGSKTRIGCLPSDLWTKYFSSSKIVKNIIKIEGKDSFIVEVRKIFTNSKQCLLYESKFLTKIKAANNPMWYNQHESVPLGPFPNSAITRSRKSKSKIGRKWINNGVVQFLIKLSELQYYINLGFSLGKKKSSLSTKEKVSESSKNRIHIYHALLKTAKFIKLNDWPIYEIQGFIQGRIRKEESNKKQAHTNTGKIYIKNVSLGICKVINPVEFSSFKDLGYIQGVIRHKI